VRDQQCAKGQGYLFSRPLTSPALLDWLRAAA
jgi:EAL domain-containing protein (putative c-di-GMP-specific phosphodiesterase class I)